MKLIVCLVIFLNIFIPQSQAVQVDDDLLLDTLRLNIEGLNPVFDPNVYDYYINITNDINEIEVIAKPKNERSTVEVIGNKNLKQGINYIEIKVISENKTNEQTYKIEVTKTADIKKANTNLETLAVQDVLLEPAFDNNITNYKVEVSETINELNILAIPEDENGKIEIIGNENLKQGENIIKIVITAPNGITNKEIEINVYKRNSSEEQNYIEREKSDEQKLEEAYKVKKVVAENAISDEEKKEITNDNKNILIVISIFSILVVLGIYIGLKNLKKNKDN